MVKSGKTVLIEMSCEILIEFSKNGFFQTLNSHLVKDLENLLFPFEVIDNHLSSFTIDKSVYSNSSDGN
jgi:hypothetical protein